MSPASPTRQRWTSSIPRVGSRGAGFAALESAHAANGRPLVVRHRRALRIHFVASRCPGPTRERRGTRGFKGSPHGMKPGSFYRSHGLGVTKTPGILERCGSARNLGLDPRATGPLPRHRLPAVSDVQHALIVDPAVDRASPIMEAGDLIKL